MLSLGLVGTWVYHLYDKTQYSQRRTEIFIKDSIAVAEGVRDSLQKIYTATINDLDIRLDSTRLTADSIKTQLNVKLGEIYKLKGEIDGILKNRGATKADLQLARSKINELQGLVDDLRNQKNTMEEEKQRLNGVLAQLAGDFEGLQQTMKKLDAENNLLKEKVNQASVFVASELKLVPVTVKNDKELETEQAKKATKFVISFAVQNNINEYSNADVYVVITQPDGQIVKNDDVWESTTTSTANGNKISYTRKVRFDYEKGETKRLLFSVNADEYLKGNYTVQLYHNGYAIGKTSKTLN